MCKIMASLARRFNRRVRAGVVVVLLLGTMERLDGPRPNISRHGYKSSEHRYHLTSLPALATSARSRIRKALASIDQTSTAAGMTGMERGFRSHPRAAS
jgi:hypothetical protein